MDSEIKGRDKETPRKPLSSAFLTVILERFLSEVLDFTLQSGSKSIG